MISSTQLKDLSSEGDMILTRAGRRKAGLPPPLPLFNAGPKTIPSTLEVKLSKVRRTACSKSACTNESSSSSDENEGERTRSSKRKKIWVQCDHVRCGKWRVLPNDSKIDAKDHWYCSMHPEPSLTSCDLPEEQWGTCCKRGYVFSELEMGQLVWAKMQGYPPWPAIITPDPWSDNTHIAKEKEGAMYHVEFLGKHRTHLWITEQKVEPYNRTRCSLSSVYVKTAAFVLALQEADSLCMLSNENKLKTCIYTDEFAKAKVSTFGQNGQNTSISSKKKKHRKQEVPCNPEDIVCLGMSALKKILSNADFDLQAYLQHKHQLGSTGKSIPLTDLTNARNIKKKRQRVPKKYFDLDSHDSFQPRTQRKNQTSFEGEQVQQKKEEVSSACGISNGSLKDHSAIVCPPHKLCGQSMPPSSMKEILEGEEEAQKELEIIENMLSLVQEGSGPVSAEEEQEVQEAVEGVKGMVTEKKHKAEERLEEKKNESLEEKGRDEWVGDLFEDIKELDDLIRGLDQASQVSKKNS